MFTIRQERIRYFRVFVFLWIQKLWEIPISRPRPWQWQLIWTQSLWEKLCLNAFPLITVTVSVVISLHVTVSYYKQPSSLWNLSSRKEIEQDRKTVFQKRSKSMGWSYFLLRSTTWFTQCNIWLFQAGAGLLSQVHLSLVIHHGEIELFSVPRCHSEQSAISF